MNFSRSSVSSLRNSADARTMDGVIARHFRDHLAAAAFSLAEESNERILIRHHVVDAAIGEIKIGLFLGRIRLDCRASVILLGVVGVDGRALHADRLALERFAEMSVLSTDFARS